MVTRPTTPVLEPELIAWVADRARAVLRYRGRALTFFCATMALVTVALLVWPRTYLSQAKLFVRLGRESVAIDPTVTTGATISVSDTREHEINSVMEMIGNRAVLEDVVRVLGPAVVTGTAPVPPAATVDEQLADAFHEQSASPLAAAAPAPQIERAVKTLETIITSDLAKKSSVIHLSCKAQSPELAQTILKVFLAAFQLQYSQAHRADQSFPFFVEQAELLQRELERATSELVAAKNEVGVVSLDDRRLAVEEDFSRTRRELQDSRVALDAARATLKDLDEKQRELPRWQIAEEINGQPDDAIGATRRALYDLQVRERDLLTRYTPRHPLVLAVRQQISQAERLLAGASPDPLAETKRTPDPAWQQVHLQRLSTESEVEALSAKAAQLESQLGSLQAERSQLNREEGRVRRLQQQVDVLQTSYAAYLDRREQSRIAQALGRERISNVNVIQPASYVSQPVAPKRSLIFVLAAFVAAVGGVGVALISEVLETPAVSQSEHLPADSVYSNELGELQGCQDAIERVSRLVETARR
jgi:uncharacterized protein involved in exopolysaccharide biosynthesis